MSINRVIDSEGDERSELPPLLLPSYMPGAGARITSTTSVENSRTPSCLWTAMLLIVGLLTGAALLVASMTLVAGDWNRLAVALAPLPTPTITPTPGPPDSDGDSIADEVDNCSDRSNTDQSDVDNDGVGDACDNDIDGDSIANEVDNCLLVVNPQQVDIDNDLIGDDCDNDHDNDQIPNELDNCPNSANPAQANIDDDALGDACDDQIDLSGLSLDISRTIYIGSDQAAPIVSISSTQTLPGPQGFFISTTMGTLATRQASCDSVSSQTLTIAAADRSFILCPPASEGEAQLITKYADNRNAGTAIGGVFSLEFVREDLQLDIIQLDPLDTPYACVEALVESSDTSNSVESRIIPFDLAVTSNMSGDRSYTLSYQGTGRLYAVPYRDNFCDITDVSLVTDGDDITIQNSARYRLFYEPASDGENMVFRLRSNMRDDIDAQSVVMPIIRVNTSLKLRDSNGEVAQRIVDGQRLVVAGIGGENLDRWMSVRMNGEFYWLNVGRLGDVYTTVGDITQVPQIQIPGSLLNSPLSD